MIKDFLQEERSLKRTSFHMPGHKGKRFFIEEGYEKLLRDLVDFDITEILGADNLHQPEGPLLKLMEAYQKLYEVDKTFLLVNGSTCGIIAAILGTVKNGKKLLMARSCHRSVYSALALGKINPITLPIYNLKPFNIMGGVDVEILKEVLEKEHNEIGAFILPSPNYYGICSDIKLISDLCHKYDIPLIVDQAHGAHLKFFEMLDTDMPKSAESCGADIVINSTHKTLASFTQSGIMNIQGNLVDSRLIGEKLQLVESTSPSYLLMLSLDVNREILQKRWKILFENWFENISYFYKEASKIEGLTLVDCKNLDRTKLNLDMSRLNIDGRRLEELLLDEGIVIELFTGNIAMAMTGIGNTKEDYNKLLNALKKIALNVEKSKDSKEFSIAGEFILPSVAEYCDRNLWEDCPKEEISLDELEGRISAASIVPYPPGIPFLLEGEICTNEIQRELQRLYIEGKTIYGVKSGRIWVYKDRR